MGSRSERQHGWTNAVGSAVSRQMVLVAVLLLFGHAASYGSYAVDVHINSEDVEKLLQLEWSLLDHATEGSANEVRQDIAEFQPPFRAEMVEHPINVTLKRTCLRGVFTMKEKS